MGIPDEAISSIDRVITFPGSLNGETGLICSYLEGYKGFERTPVSKIVWQSKFTKFI